MKKTAILAGLLMATQAAQLQAFSFFKSSSAQDASSEATVSSDKGGVIEIGGEAYEVPAGESLHVSGGGITAKINTEQETGKEPVTSVVLEEHPQVATVNGKPAKPVTGVSEEDLTPEEEAEIEADLDMDDAYEI